VAHVTVNPDVTPPGISTVVTYPSFDPATQVATLNQVIVEFNEAVKSGAATVPGNYVFSGGASAVSAVMTNASTVVLALASPLSDDTPYTLQVNNVLDLVDNNINTGGANNPASFRSWVRGPGNGLSYQRYNSDPGVTVQILTNSAAFPNNPFLRTISGLSIPGSLSGRFPARRGKGLPH